MVFLHRSGLYEPSASLPPSCFHPRPLPSSSLTVSQALPQLQILHKLLHRHLIQEHKVWLPELQALQLRHPCPAVRQPHWIWILKKKRKKKRTRRRGTESSLRKKKEKYGWLVDGLLWAGKALQWSFRVCLVKSQKAVVYKLQHVILSVSPCPHADLYK